MTIDQYVINAFTKGKFTGNPAAVCPLTEWISDEKMQQIAMQNNLSETAFLVEKDSKFHIRWFTPKVEVDLCGHATLASAHVIFNNLSHKENLIDFTSKSGPLQVKKMEKAYQLNFPADQITKAPCPEPLSNALGAIPTDCYQGKDDWLIILEDQKTIENLTPDYRLLESLGGRGIITSALGEQVDFVSRCFYPAAGIDEDPATGSAHTTLTPYWHKVTGQSFFKAIQLSDRKGFFDCEYANDRILISGSCDLFSEGRIMI